MENMNKCIDRRDNLINELLQGIEFAKKLQNHFMNPNNSKSLSSLSDDNKPVSNFKLLEKLLLQFDKTISMAKLLQNHQDPSFNLVDNNYGQLESSHSLTMSSPKSENSPTNFSPSKKRKTMMPKWSKTVKISNGGGSAAGLEGSLSDGFSWRKYGQKEILGAKFPRNYYRCTHRHSRGCAATKQVQISDEDTTICQIMYRGEHTCTQGAQLKKAQSNPNIPAQINSNPLPPPSPQQQEVYVGLSPEGDLKVEPELDLDNPAQIFRCFSFNQAQQLEPIDDNCMLSFCPSFGSPTTSESNCLPMVPYQATTAHVGLAVQTSETEFNDAVSGPNSVTNSPVMGGGDFEFLIDVLQDFDGNFPFEFELP